MLSDIYATVGLVADTLFFLGILFKTKLAIKETIGVQSSLVILSPRDGERQNQSLASVSLKSICFFSSQP